MNTIIDFFKNHKGLGERDWERGQGFATPGPLPQIKFSHIILEA